MRTLNVRNVNRALQSGVELILAEGVEVDSRVGRTLEIPCPVATVYSRPWERVLINKTRDANPFFHLMEAMWILAGREDVKFLTEFNKRMVDYSDDGMVFNAPYGYRLRTGLSYHHDQLGDVIKTLQIDPNSRQAVCQIWDDEDLMKKTKDKACNMSIVFRVRSGLLDMTVYNRSNDMIWGAYGANAVQFSMIQEYVAAHVGIPMGTYTQITNAYHVYTEGPGGAVWDRVLKDCTDKPYRDEPYDSVQDVTLMSPEDMNNFEHDLQQFFVSYDMFGIEEIGELRTWRSRYFTRLVMPVLCIYLIHRQHGPEQALKYTHTILADDWKLACEDWLTNRMEARK